MMENVFEILKDLPKPGDYVLLTVAKGSAAGEKAILAEKKIIWESKENGFFSAHFSEAGDLKKCGLYEIREQQVFCDIIGGQEHLVICGGGHVSVPVIKIGIMLGWKVTVLEDRPQFADHARNAGATEVICQPFEDALDQIEGDKDTYFVVLTRGHRYDQVCLEKIVGKEHAYIGMIAGEEISLNDALHALLMASANEVAYAIAENVGGLGYDGFIAKMNERAKELGAVNSDFENPNGLNAQNHYTTARDMALITQELLENHEEFKTIAQTQQYTIGATNLVNQARTFQQSDLMFYEGNDYYYPKTIAGKTGYTDEALNTLVSCAADDNLELISVVLKTHGKNVYPDSVNLLEYGFNNFAKYTIADYEDSADFKEIDPNAYVVLPENVNFQSLDYEITQDDTNSSTGTVTYTYQGNPVGKAAVTLSDEYLQKDNTENEAQVSGDKSDSETQKQAQSTIPREVILVICVIAAVLLLIIVWRAVLKHLRKKKVETNRKRRREVDKD